ncbi:MAG: 6-bladed beta-propeller [Gemmatimonadota bacterium]|nr:6-bladed beta-propeller [Gemmatimonadota bacterium]
MRRIAQGFVALTFFGCGGDTSPASPAAEVVDSAGVTIVTSQPGAAAYAELALEPSLSIGVLEGPEELLFDGIATVVRDGEGNFVVADNGAGEIRIFDAEGNHLRSFGGRGEGPGEFQALVGAWPLADGSIVAADRRLQRITRFDAEGSLLGTGALLGVDAMAMLTPVGISGSETFLSRIRPFTMPSMDPESTMRSLEEAFEGDAAPPEYFLRYRLDGTPVDTLAQHPGLMMSVSASGSGAEMSLNLLRVPFSPDPSASGSIRGVAITGGRSYEVSVFDETGALNRIVRLAEAPTPRTDEHLEAHVRNSGNPFAQDEASIRQMIANYEELPLPESLPAYTDLRIADNGELWARRHSLRGASTVHWDVFGADGVYLGRVEVPSSFLIEEVSRGQVIGVSRDEFGVERVEVRELTLSGR